MKPLVTDSQAAAKTPKRPPPKASPGPRGRRRTAAEDAALCRRFLTVLGRGTTMAGASRKVGLPYRTLMKWLDPQGPDFRAEFARDVSTACQQSRESVVADLAEMGRKTERKTYRVNDKGERVLWQVDVKPDPSALARVADIMHGVGQRLEVTGAEGAPLAIPSSPEARELEALRIMERITAMLVPIRGGTATAAPLIEGEGNP